MSKIDSLLSVFPRPAVPSADEPKTFKQVVEAEWNQIRERREVWGVQEAPRPDRPNDCEPPKENSKPPPLNLVGLALSGGGIRSATFCLGLLQELSRRKMLKMFDYVSTVSGGGFTGGWWSAWLTRGERKERKEGAEPAIFPSPEQCEPQRWPEYVAAKARGDTAMPDASLSAHRRDPIHHLRLFANYLTPRKGALSADTWRAGTIVARNLILTWLVLLPILLAAILVGQTFFVMHPHREANFLPPIPKEAAAGVTATGAQEVRADPSPPIGVRTSPPAVALADREALARERELSADSVAQENRDQRWERIEDRALVAARPLVVLLSWTVVLTLLWMLYGPGGGGWHFGMTVVGTGAAGYTLVKLYQAVAPPGGGWALPIGWMILGVAGIIALLFANRLVPPPGLLLSRNRGEEEGGVQVDLFRNRVVRVHARVLMALGVLTAVLLVAGFSHDIVWYLFDSESGGPLPEWVKKTGGWAAVVATVGAMLFTGIAGSPVGGDGEAKAEPGLKSRIVFALAPIMATVLLAVLAATAGRALIRAVGAGEGLSWAGTALLVGVGLFLLFAGYEAVDGDKRLSLPRQRLVPVAATFAGAAVLLFGPDVQSMTWPVVAIWALAAVFLVLRWVGLRHLPAASASGQSGVTSEPENAKAQNVKVQNVEHKEVEQGRTEGKEVEEKNAGEEKAKTALPTGRRRWVAAAMATLAVAGIAGLSWYVLELIAIPQPTLRSEGSGSFPWGLSQAEFYRILLAGILTCGVFALAEHLLARSERWRALALVTVAFLVLSAGLLLPFLPLDAGAFAYSTAAVALATFAAAWVVGLGWMADPNLVSLHAFYKARLVRAYMGASNPKRFSQEITESAVGDDIPLKSLKNCSVGAPYHLVNTTLNLVGGRDLGTVQRSADSFVLSKDFCGSSRTGYRPTGEYMGGKLTLGTAVAVSGAAASPNMGSKTPSAALAMLLALLNVRLSFWAPTPSKPRWRDAQPRLWPFYLLRECLSQTNDLSAYCCLSDGGHFDNTGLYPLVARGCRYIVLADCGADPRPCFEDIGNAIRRCRIDFGAEIDLRIDDLLRSDRGASAAHYVVGTIRYSEPHAEALGWSDDVERGGVVVWIKPSMTATAEPADVRQYDLENDVFPQQTTADQWYDEAQFESYRRLGQHSAQAIFDGKEVPDRPDPSEVKKFFDGLLAPRTKKIDIRFSLPDSGGKRFLQIVEEMESR